MPNSAWCAHLAGDAFLVMARDHVADLVTQHGGQLILVLCDGEDAGIHADLATRQRERIGFLVGEDRRFPRDAALYRRQLPHQALTTQVT